MANLQSFKKCAVGQIIAHNCRTEKSKTRRFSNENIDKEKTKNNYFIARHGESFGRSKYDEILSRSDVFVPSRKDLNTMCSICVTLPKDYDGDKTRFFCDCKMALDKIIVGSQFCIAAVVHEDEKTPHLHYMFVPVVRNKDKERNGAKAYGYDYKVSSKALCTRQFLRILHPMLERELRARQPDKTINIVTGELRERKNLPIRELQARGRAERLEKAEKTLSAKEKEVNQREQAAEIRLQKAEKTLSADTKSLQRQIMQAKEQDRLNGQETAFIKAFYRFLENECGVKDWRAQQRYCNRFQEYAKAEKQHQQEQERGHNRNRGRDR